MRLGGWLWGTVAIAALAGSVRADGEIPIVTLDRNGPSREIPTSSSFYVQGAAGKASRAQLLVVRVGSPSLFGERLFALDDTPSCAAVFGQLKTFAGGGKTLPDLPAQMTTADQLWQGAPSRYRVKVSASWKPEGDATTYKLLVPKDTEFFASGFRFCIAVYLTTTKETVDTTIGDALQRYVVDTIRRCRGVHQDDPDACQATTQAALDAQLAGVPAAQRAAVAQQVADALGAGLAAQLSVVRIEAMVHDWIGAAVQPAAVHVQYDAFAPAPHPLARATIALLAHHGSLFPAIAPGQTPTVTSYFTPSGKLKATGVAFLAGGAIRLAGAATGTPNLPASARTHELIVPGTKLTLADVLAVSRGELPYDTDWLAPAQVEARLAPLLRKIKREHALAPAELALLGTLRARLLDVADGIRALDAAAHAAPTPEDGTPGAIRRDLGTWLEAGVLAACKDSQLVAWQFDPAAPSAGCTPGKHGWPGYGDPSSGPLALLGRAFEKLARDYPEWLAKRPKLTTAVTSSALATDPYHVRLEYTPKTWFFSYVSPVIGYAVVVDSRDVFAKLYYGLQLHTRPNPKHESVITAGSRGLGFELGLAPDTGTFGPDGRYRGLFGLGAVYVGAVVHVIPYTSFSIGYMLAEHRRSTLPEERYRMFHGLYLGFTVDVNIPGIVKDSFDTTKTTQAP